MAGDARYGIDELAALGGVTRRTVRYYVREGLLQAPHGLGRGRHYGPEHLERLLAVKSLQEQGLTLDEVRGRFDHGRSRRTAVPPTARAIARSVWTRLEIVPGVDVHVSAARRVPAPEQLRELADWCERHFRRQDG